MPGLFTPTEFESHLQIVFHDPGSANALGLPAAREFAALVKSYKRWTQPVVVRGGHPRLFCSGGQLSDYKKLKGKAPGLKINREITAILDTFGKWPAVKLAVIEGDVFGGGMEWLARFDFRWSTPAPLFAFWQRRIGLSTGWGGGKVWAGKIGEDRVRQLLIEARLLSAAEALHLGLLDRVLSPWSVNEAVARWAHGIDSDLTHWSAGKEGQVFQNLWMGPKHQAVLKNWKAKK